MYAEGHDIGVHTFNPHKPGKRLLATASSGTRPDPIGYRHCYGPND
jgi:hypothetical protein